MRGTGNGRFIIIGENIHTTRVIRRNAPSVETDELKPAPRRNLGQLVRDLETWRKLAETTPHAELAHSQHRPPFEQIEGPGLRVRTAPPAVELPGAIRHPDEQERSGVVVTDAGEHEIRHVGARDKQHKPNRAQQDEKPNAPSSCSKYSRERTANSSR